MENVVNLNERRASKAEPEQVRLPENAEKIMSQFVDDFLNEACEHYPMWLIIAYAKDAIEMEMRSIPFDKAFERVEKEFPELACKFKKDMSV